CTSGGYTNYVDAMDYW
nr:immunoglobulin heavy chain junction region [Mus musculus]NSM04333.1 immunoglobulin heavy chain junction region [Mus musculus]NSM04458.1 immunoglobulin heavy chain junction region [Mus musculus]NSM05512.1 immunoglobulin heavy chain junction region [Mus musculus]NSM05663.1 immunoglobulin heavy chain junction region [Mus musculus]